MPHQMTRLLCLQDSYLYECDAQVLAVEPLDNGQHAVTLDQTVFYPQGGGQPTDRGRIVCGDVVFAVEMVTKGAGGAVHVGRFSPPSPFPTGSTAHCTIDKERRILNSRYHTAGHAIDVGLIELGAADWEPVKGDHSPERGAFIEYRPPPGTTSDQVALVMSKLQDTCKVLIEKGLKSSVIAIAPHDIPTEHRRHLGPQIQALETVRINRIEGIESYWMPCGGTLCKCLAEIGALSISKYSFKKGLMRVCYALP